MKVLVAGASGKTGKWLVEHLLGRGHEVKVIVRSPEKLPETWKMNDRLSIVKAAILDLSDSEMQEHVRDCHAVASCLGHNLTFKGLFGKPRRLVTDAVRRLCEAIQENGPEQPVKFVLMNTSGNKNRDLNERRSFGEKVLVGIIRLLLPPHADNEQAADYLRVQVGQDAMIHWVAVRPDGLIDAEKVTEYSAFPSPIRSAIFNAGKVSRINVAHFMADLITEDEVWEQWKGQMPVVYNDESVNSH